MTRRRLRTGFARTAAGALDWLVERRARHRRAVALVSYAGISAVAYAGSYLLRFEFAIPRQWLDSLVITLPALVMVRSISLWAFGLVRGRWRFVGIEDVVRLVAATTAGSALFFVLVWTAALLPRVPRSVLLIEWFVTTLLTAGLWMSYRLVLERSRRVRGEYPEEAKRVLIVGAGEAGNLLAREIRRLPNGYRLVGFVDDDPRMRGSTLRGVQVLGNTAKLPTIADAIRPDEIIIAVPSATPVQIRRIVERCESLDIPFKVLPGIASVLEGDVRLGHLRDLRIEDLLGRDPISLELPEVEATLGGKCILITGGAGSIGSELARQVALYRPDPLVLLDRAESDLYLLQRQLEELSPEVDVIPVISDILDAPSLRDVFDAYRPQRVFHAAAYKHVPMMESNVRQAIVNNVFGTRAVADAAGSFGAEGFTLVSTDKAVEPVSVMGATKRVAERVCIACGEVHSNTGFVAVRFGNVLGSQGSVLPLFRRQLQERRALTVTHPDVSRYFMTISEAAQLVLQASTLDDARGHIMMLDMGEPVRILDLARDLIRLAGLKPDRDVSIRFTGLRPGEKLHEELEGRRERTLPTAFEKVRVIQQDSGSSESWVLAELDRLEGRHAEMSDEALREALFALAREDLVADREFARPSAEA